MTTSTSDELPKTFSKKISIVGTKSAQALKISCLGTIPPHPAHMLLNPHF